jgi:phosphoribosylpyrophosphate synthetase
LSKITIERPAKSIRVILPHFGYARQDKKSASREPISARLVADLLTTAGATRVITMDLHSDHLVLRNRFSRVMKQFFFEF